jgi:hypothetical protein
MSGTHPTELELARDDPALKHPTYLVHPETTVPMPFNVRSEAICPNCGGFWVRGQEGVKLVEG